MNEKQFRKILEEVLDEVLERKLDQKLDQKLEQNNAVLFGQIVRYLDGRLDEFRVEMNGRFDHLATIEDVLAGRTTADEIERAALGHQVDRHDHWIGQLAEATGTKLMPGRSGH